MELVTVIFCLVIAVISFVISMLSFMEKGMLLNNAWFYASKEERREMDKRPHYRQSGVVFCFIGTIFVLYAVRVMTGWETVNFSVSMEEKSFW